MWYRLVLGGVFVLCLLPVSSAIDASQGTRVILESGWEQSLFPGLNLRQEALTLDEKERSAIYDQYSVESLAEAYEVYIARDANGELKGGLLITHVTYQEAGFTLAVGLNEEFRVIKVMIPNAEAAIFDQVNELAPRGIVTRYTFASLRQIQYIARTLQDREDIGSLVSTEALRAGLTLKVLMEKQR